MKNFIDATMKQQISDLQELIRIPSVSRGEPKPGKPLGEQVHRALEFALNLARRLGFTKVWDLDGFCGIVEYGEGEECLGVMAHLDVVPAGDGWDVPPFSAVIKDGRMYGRGTVDNKGPAVAALYALAAVKDSKITLSRRVRIILGCDEERGWACMDKYKQFEEEPTLAFTPDAEYPVVHSEMGILQTTYHIPLQTGLRCEIGSAPNVIPGFAEVKFEKPLYMRDLPDGLKGEVFANRLTVTGKGGHASMPELAHNALQGAISILSSQPLLNADERKLMETLHELLGFDLHGESLGIDVTDESGRTSYAPTMLKIDEQGVTFTADCRYPFSLQYPELLARLDSAFGSKGFARIHQKNSECHFISPDSELVTALMDVFNHNSGLKLAPMSIGGGTYARAFKNAVAFGTVPYNEESPCHMPNESTALADIRFNTIVMAEAIERLAGKK